MESTLASQDSAGSHTTRGSGHSRNTTAKRVVVPQGTRIKDTDLLQTEESTYVDNYFTTRRYRHPYATLDRSFRLFDWRLVDKYHTYGAILAVCLRIGIDPPDITKPEVCAKLEAWIDPFAEPPNAALARIAQNLYKQYEFLNQNLRCKLLTDPTIEDTKRSTVHMRRQAKGGRILFHYNGHGVPKPTANGDIWVFNSNYTQYMPVSVQDIQIWLGSPGVFVYDCSAAGNILEAFVKHAKRKDIEWLAAVSAQTERDILGIPPPSGGASASTTSRSATDSHSRPSSKTPGLASLPHSHSVHFAACRGDENLPMSPHLPADVFTACMTTPVEMAMRWWIMRHGQLTEFNQAAVTMVPGEVNNRRTPLGEINWIFTAITDTIAWNTLPKEAFKKLFRHDMLIANLFRNFMFASRVMRYYGCHPMSYPELPSTHDHPLWEAFEHALDDCLGQLPDFYSASQNQLHYEYMPSDFFTFQLDSFETYLSYGAPQNLHPELLPIILQVLLSQLHRNRALRLLAEFLRFGRWAVNECLAVGIFPYVLKLISSSQMNSRGYLAAIWHAIISVDYSVRYDLLRSNAPTYFVELLMDENPNLLDMTPVTVAACRVHCLMLLTHLCRDFPEAQQACGQLEVLIPHMNTLLEPTNSTPTRQWACLLFSELGKNHMGNVHQAIQADLHEAIFPLLEDPVVEVRAAAVNALGAFFGPIVKTEHTVNIELIIAINLIGVAQDASPVVRKEVVIALSRYLKRYPEPFFTLAMESIQRRQQEAWSNVTSVKSGTGSRGTTGSPAVAGTRHKSTTGSSKRASLQSLSRQSSLRKPALSATQPSPYSNRTAGQLHFPGSNAEENASHHAVASPEVARSLALAIAQRTVGSHSDSVSTSGMGAMSEGHEDSTEANLSTGSHRGESDQVPNEAYLAIWRTILRLSSDPMADIAQLACLLVDFVVHPLIMAITAINSQGWSHKGPTPSNDSTDSLHSVSSTPGAYGPRQRSVSSHYAPLVSPTWSGSYQSTAGGSPSETPRETVSSRPHHTSDASALEALSHAVGKYAFTTTTATPPELGDATRRPSMGSGSGSPRTTPPTPTKQRAMDSQSMASKLTSSLKRSASSTINLMYNFTAGSTGSVHQVSPAEVSGGRANPPLTPTAAQMRFQMARGGASGGTTLVNDPVGTVPSNRWSAVFSHEDPSLRSLDTPLGLDSASWDLGTSVSRTLTNTPLSKLEPGRGNQMPYLPRECTQESLQWTLTQLPTFEPPVELPLVSKYLEWQTLLVTEPYLRQPEDQQEGSRAYLSSVWRKTRNDSVISAFESARTRVRENTRWDRSNSMSLDHTPNKMLFHRYEKQLVVTDGKQLVSIWDWDRQVRLHQFQLTPLLSGMLPMDITPYVVPHLTTGTTLPSTPSAGGSTPAAGHQGASSYFFSSHSTSTAAPSGTPALEELTGVLPNLPRVTSLQLINEMDYAVLMVGTHDGTLRFFQNYADPDQCEMVTSWQNFTEHVQDRRRPTKVVTEWVQRTGKLYVTGSTNTINVWDLAEERCVRRITSKTTGIVNVVSANQLEGHYIYCGGSDGVVRVYDDRMAPSRCQVIMLGEPSPYAVIQVTPRANEPHTLMSAATDGRVRIWDLRKSSVLGSLTAHSSGVLSQLVVHDNLPIFATSSGTSSAAYDSYADTNGTGSGGPHSSTNGGTKQRGEISSNHSVKIWNTRFKSVGIVRHYTGLLSQRVASVTALAMDHFNPTLAMGNDDSTVTFLRPVS